jgi:Transposase DDE domain
VRSEGARLRIRRLGGSRAGEMRLTRFLRNSAVTPEAMVEAAAARTAERCAGLDVLAIQDTTVVRSEGGGGLYLHPVLATDLESGAILGLAQAAFLTRSEGKAWDRRRRPVAEKESQRWLDGAAAAGRVCARARQVTVVADREADIYAAFARRPSGVTLVVRAAHDRALEDEGRLFAMLDAQPVAGRATLALPARPGRRARDTKIEARILRTALQRPCNGLVEDLPQSVEVTMVDIRESAAPADEPAVQWRLITTRAVGDAPDAFAVADLYRRRWAIEQLFRTLKSDGFDIERALIEAEAPLCNLIMATLIAAVSVQQLVHARDGAAEDGSIRPLTDAFEPADAAVLTALCAELEGKTGRQKNPHPLGSLGYGAWVCARLGGWTGYYGKPGPIVMFNGWKIFQSIKHGAALRVRWDV